MQLIHLAPSHPTEHLQRWFAQLPSNEPQAFLIGLHAQFENWIQNSLKPRAEEPRHRLAEALSPTGSDAEQLQRWFQALDWLEEVPADFATRLRRWVLLRRTRQIADLLGLPYIESPGNPAETRFCCPDRDGGGVSLLPRLATSGRLQLKGSQAGDPLPPVQFWMEKPAFFTADPQQIPQARLLLGLNSVCAQELARLQGLELDPEALDLLGRADITAEIGWLQHPEWPSSRVVPQLSTASAVLSVTAGPAIQVISLRSQRMWRRVGFLAQAFEHLARFGLSVDLLATSQTSVALTLDPGQVVDERMRESLASMLECEVDVQPDCACIHLIGNKIRQMLPQLGPALELFDEHPIHLVSQSSSDVSLSLVVNADQVPRLLRSLHALLFGGGQESDILGPTYQQLGAGGQRSANPSVMRWWKEERERLLALAQEGPAYVYHRGTVGQRAAEVQSISCVDHAFYALKANPFPPILQYLSAQGFGLECVSPGELERAAVAGHRRLFTPNFVGPEEYAAAFAQECWVTLDNVEALRRWPEVFRGRTVLLRLDSGTGSGHHKHVRTAGDSSKFGISSDQFAEMRTLLRDHKVDVLGLHCHAGSGITDAEHWVRTAQFLYQAAEEHFPSATVLNLGGGLGIPDRPGKQRLDFARLHQSLEAFLALHPGRRLWLEPGRYLVAEAGVIVARVNQVKTKGERRYIGVEVGMNTLIRPALYGAYHPIVNLSRLDEPAVWKADIVGPICESGDVLGHDRWMPATEPGDVLLIDNAGAYGASMTSSYNLRPPARECWLE
jgi:bifunctional diaminopimelate decarboxylase / aspartate kinase